MSKEKLAAVIVTLNKIETRGKENLRNLLGCIQTLEELMEEEKLAAVQNQTAEK